MNSGTTTTGARHSMAATDSSASSARARYHSGVRASSASTLGAASSRGWKAPLPQVPW